MNIIKNRLIYFSISWIFFILSISLLLFGKLNLWIDMTWWIQIEYNYNNSINIEELRTDISKISDEVKIWWKKVINDISVYKITWENVISVISGFDSSLNEKDLEDAKIDFRNKSFEILKGYDSEIVESSYINIWKSFWDYIKDTAFLTLIIAIIAITIYVTWAFSWVVSWINVFSFSWITILTLFHDVIIASGLYIITSILFPEFKIDTFFVTALLTILWYSINDTIVVFDRIRSNLKNFKKYGKSLERIINVSIEWTLKRSIYTSLTLLFVLITIFLFWPETISGFTLIMIYGTIVWTYSSIFIASPLLYELNKNKKIDHLKEKNISAEDKIVV